MPIGLGLPSLAGGSADHPPAGTLAASPLRVTRFPPLPPFALEVAAGTAGGVAALSVGHPFDTTKVKLQRAGGGTSALSVVQRTLAAEGVKGLYAGIQAPLPFVVAHTAAMFATNSALRAALGRGRGDDELTIPEVAVAGLGAGVAISFVSGPTELVKCRMQANPFKYNGVLDCTRRVYAAGGLRAFAVGGGSTLLREAPGTAIFFGVYEGLTRAFKSWRGTKTNNMAEQVLAGGCAGFLYWVPCYPVDFCKTLIQTDSIRKPKYAGLMDCARRVVAENGLRGLYKGVGPALARSFPACGVTFLAYEQVKSALGDTAKI